MDVLTDVMQTVRLRSNVYGRVEFTAPWGLRSGGCNNNAIFFVVSRGSCWLQIEGDDALIPISGGDLVFLPTGIAHSIRDSPTTPVIPIEDILAEQKPADGMLIRHGGGGSPVSLVCGCFTFEDGGNNPLVECLPPLIHVKADSTHSVQWLESTLQFVASETAGELPGAVTIASRLADILFIQAVRAYMATTENCPAGWLKALGDRQIGEALRLIHETPAAAWTVESLAKRVAMSRSAFAAHFTAEVGESPLRYLTSWRMRKASLLLRHGSPIAAAAREVGYQTDAAFGKAFRRFTGLTPGEYRRRISEVA
jgi:AraC-like DNA-binding protein